jgi:hypothetical protein
MLLILSISCPMSWETTMSWFPMATCYNSKLPLVSHDMGHEILIFPIIVSLLTYRGRRCLLLAGSSKNAGKNAGKNVQIHNTIDCRIQHAEKNWQNLI